MSTPDADLKAAIVRAGDELSRPAPADLGVRLKAQRARLARRRMAARVLAVAAVVLVVAVGLTLLNDDDERADIYAGPASSTTATPSTTESGAIAPGTGPEATTMPTTELTTTTAPTTTAPAVSPITEGSRMSLYGLGEVRGGMTIREAEALTGQAFVVDSFDMAEGLCYFATIDGFDDLY